MPSYRKTEDQVEFVINLVCALGQSKKDTKNNDKKLIYSKGAKRSYTQSIKQFSTWCKDNKFDFHLKDISEDIAMAYLIERSKTVRQSQLKTDRTALLLLPSISDLEMVRSVKGAGRLAQISRVYTKDQISCIKNSIPKKSKLSLAIIEATGIRTHELLTIRPANEQPKSSRRQWVDERFSGLKGSVYTVIGKGGLIREIILPKSLAVQLEFRHLIEPRTIIDREIEYESHYDLIGGKNLSNQFSKASKELFGGPKGLHGVRHSYVQRRMEHLLLLGFNFNTALGLVSQEVGHFRPEITRIYLR